MIEGDPQSFDDSVFSVDELEKAVVVKIADRQWRYSRFPEVPLFGRAARESRMKASMPSVKCFPNASPRSPLMYRKPSVCIRRSAALWAVIWRWRLSLTRKQKSVN
ncbi:hypothetical protein ACULNC_19960 [Shigella flexneri]